MIPIRFNYIDVSYTIYMIIFVISICFPTIKTAGSSFKFNKATTSIPNPDMPEPKMKTILLFGNHSTTIYNK
jgi:hypothetical protein